MSNIIKVGPIKVGPGQRGQNQPDWQFEQQFGALGPVAGVDEAGRGPLAGPVVAAAIILDPRNIPIGLNDSKKLSPAKRSELYTQIISANIYGIGISEPEEIDRINVLAATMIAMERAVNELGAAPTALLIDGNRAPNFTAAPQDMRVITIVKGDARSLSIAAASIIAKVTRDEIMIRANSRFPGYGFDGHKGYPTKKHRDNLQQNKACPIHRRSFKPVKAVLT